MKLVEEASAGKTGRYARTDNGKSGSSVSRRKEIQKRREGSESSVDRGDHVEKEEGEFCG
jgi:hypothetical protein